MKTGHFVHACMLVALLFAPTMTALAFQFQQNIWYSGTTVKIVNDTGVPIVAQVGTSEKFIPAGESKAWNIDGGLFLFSGNSTQLAVGAQICKEIRSSHANPPAWATNQNLLGGLAITTSYLSSNPRESDLKRKVRLIKKYLDRREQVGRKQLKKELDRWFRGVKRWGFAGKHECVGPHVGGPQLSTYSSPNNRRVITLYVRRGAQRGYRIGYN